MTYDQIMEIKRLMANCRDSARLHPGTLKSLDALDMAITRIANEDTRKRAAELRHLSAIQHSLENLQGYQLTRKQA